MFLSFVKLDQTWPTEGKLTTAVLLVRVGSQLPQPEISYFWVETTYLVLCDNIESEKHLEIIILPFHKFAFVDKVLVIVSLHQGRFSEPGSMDH